MLTLANLFCGILAIKVGFSEHYYLAGFFVIFGAIFDFFDGFAARLLKVQGEMGKQLDSLADMVTFGVAPGVVMYSFLKIFFNDHYMSVFDIAPPFIAFLIPILSAVRLAKFNIDTNQSDKFIGLPTPANAIFFISIPLVFYSSIGFDVLSVRNIVFSGVSPMGSGGMEFISLIMKHHVKPELLEGLPFRFIINFGVYLVPLIIIFSYLLNAPIEMIALKFKTFGWKGNEIRFIFLGLSVVVILLSLLISSVFVSVPIIILLYIVLSVINNFFKKSKNELQS